MGRPLAASIAAIGIGAAWALLVQATPARHAPRQEPRVAPPRATAGTARALEHALRTRRMLAPTAELDKAPAVQQAVAPASLVQQEHTAALASYAALLEAHEASPINAGWARASAQRLDEDLVSRLESIEDARLDSIDCRSSSCVAELQLGSFQSAHAHAAELVSGEYSLNCATRIQLDDGAAQDEPYRMQLVFHDCL